jgi:hypothetical protein
MSAQRLLSAALLSFALTPLAAGTASADAGDRPIYALLGTGAIVRIGPQAARPDPIADVSRVPLRDLGSGPFLAWTRDALVAAVPGTPGRIVAVKLSTGRVRTRHTLPSGFAVRALVRGPVTGRLFVAGNQDHGDGISALRVITLSPDGAMVLNDREVKPSAALVFSAAVDEDERRLAIAYHGAAEGFDVVAPDTLSLGCASPATGGCFDGHGSLHYAGTRLFGATGSSDFEELLDSGALRRGSSRLPGNHFLELDAAGHRFLYLAGRCGYAGGLARVDLRTNRVDVLTRRHEACGSRLLVAGDRLVLAANPVPFPKPGSASRVLVIDRATAAPRRSIRTAGAIVDLAVRG